MLRRHIKFLITQFSSASCNFVPLMTKYFPGQISGKSTEAVALGLNKTEIESIGCIEVFAFINS
jgi:hypothetical protein